MCAQPSRNETGTPRALRADALQNRDRIIEAARAAYAEHGIDVPVSAIARRAGVGVATLYRRFPTRDALVAEVFAKDLTACVGVLDEALADPDPWRGFRTVLEKVSAMQVADRGFTAAVLSRFPDAADFERTRAGAEAGLAELVRRAKEPGGAGRSGRLRADFAPADVMLVLLANCGVVEGAGGSAPAASRRLVRLLTDALRADTDADPGADPDAAP
ncbi:TetR/AcrR family transcriptional regulator [Streptomyces sp. NPDC048172]|uniref:TetR/AcrR family transcriptional regulator n=1 Tax=Streptomyces sp. NPDC048172 TaxID=3365505 RepID=UPI0037135ABC